MQALLRVFGGVKSIRSKIGIWGKNLKIKTVKKEKFGYNDSCLLCSCTNHIMVTTLVAFLSVV